ncbi:MAG TPA: DUF4255 domain-containing protein [Cytophagales bacterium]|nr:DUF4255 domain-containing protein [Cytophagales bacterium]HAA24285.1 DUF4255 domain-containing protein [Cytophagales bacterium]HAP64338.1 DUF4255 domain-containing protein [Cytophagales bacterium]
MIHETLLLFRDKLNHYIKLKAGLSDDVVEFVDGSIDPIRFPLNRIAPIVVNIQEERTLRPGDYYKPVERNGLQTEIAPPIRIKLLVLFVARFKDYAQGLRFLSLIIRFFQANRVIDRDVAPDLPEEVDRLFIELMSMPVNEQNDIWNALRTYYLPSVAYRVNLLVYKDGETLAELNKLGEFAVDLKKYEN